jgi:alkylation response protein AidB-like acyl-CoA dehydrogenase
MPELTVEQVRAEARAWAEANWDPDLTVEAWWRRLADTGYASPMLPADLGGRGYTRDLANAASAGLAEIGVVGPPMGLGLMLAAPTIAVHGSDEQKRTLIPRILDGTDAWCQLFSEPGAGSDLAGLQTKAVRDGDEFVVTGQKVWTSGGQIADKGMLIARTNPDAPKHQGITYFAFDMHQPGVTVRPLREMTGRAMFNEVFLDECRVRATDIIGDLDNGWAVANTTLTVERASIGSGGGAGLGVAFPGSKVGHRSRRAGDFVRERSSTAAGSFGPGTVKRFTTLARATGATGDPLVRQGLAELHTLTLLNQWNVQRARTGQGRTGVEGNLAKLLLTHTLRRARDVGNQIVGADGMLWGDGALSGGAVQELTVFSPGPAIYGGTDQVQRNIVSERGLGLPKEPGDQRNTPFKDLQKN